MTVQELIALTGAKDMTPDAPKDREVTCGYTCDLLSWVMAHGKAGMAWITVQTHMNVIAVASLMEMAAVIIPEGNGGGNPPQGPGGRNLRAAERQDGL